MNQPAPLYIPPIETCLLWLPLDDGRVLAFCLPLLARGRDSVVDALTAAVRDDQRGLLTTIDVPGVGKASVLYAASVRPIEKSDLIDQFISELDHDVLATLDALGGMGFHASVRNYNRLAILPDEVRMRRLQALQRFPALVAPLLLTAHAAPSLYGGGRHARRQPAPEVEAAIDAGRDLAGALARHYGISKGLVRAPLNAEPWATAEPWAANYDTRCEWLALFDALPDNRRPACAADIEAVREALPFYLALIAAQDAVRAKRRFDPQPQAKVFRLGWSRTWESCRKRFGPLSMALADAGDFLAAVGARAAALMPIEQTPSSQRLAAAWLKAHGLAGLLTASVRWHALRPAATAHPEHFALPAILGDWTSDGNNQRQARELITALALAYEGDEMHHCVGDYWDDCVDGDRIFALRLPDGERATAHYVPCSRGQDDVCYNLEQLRGPANVASSDSMQALAEHIGSLLNADDKCAARRAALTASRTMERLTSHDGRSPAWLDAVSERQLRALIDYLSSMPAHSELLLVAQIAGYAHHAGPKLEAEFAVGQSLVLVREADNPYDQLAVRIDWQGSKIGYIPRPHNQAIAHAMDVGRNLLARLIEINGRFGEPWHRVQFAIETAPAPHSTTLAT